MASIAELSEQQQDEAKVEVPVGIGILPWIQYCANKFGAAPAAAAAAPAEGDVENTVTPNEYRPIPYLSREMWKTHAAAPVTFREKHIAVDVEQLEIDLAAARLAGDKHVHVSLVKGTPNNKWISIRLDLRSMGTCFTQLRKIGVFALKWDPIFHAMMVDTVRTVMKEFRGYLGFTQSDEMELIIDALENPNALRKFEGKRDKLVSLTTSLATAHLNRLVQHRAEKLEIQQVWFEVLPLDDDVSPDPSLVTPFSTIVKLRQQLKSGKGALFLGFLTQAIKPESLVVDDMGGCSEVDNLCAKASFVINNAFAATMSRDTFRACIADNLAKGIAATQPAHPCRFFRVGRVAAAHL